MHKLFTFSNLDIPSLLYSVPASACSPYLCLPLELHVRTRAILDPSSRLRLDRKVPKALQILRLVFVLQVHCALLQRCALFGWKWNGPKDQYRDLDLHSNLDCNGYHQRYFVWKHGCPDRELWLQVGPVSRLNRCGEHCHEAVGPSDRLPGEGAGILDFHTGYQTRAEAA